MNKKKTFQTLPALAAAIAAYEYNKKTIHRSSFKSENDEFHANRLLIENCLEGRGSPFVVKDNHVTQAEEDVRYLQHTSMLRTLVKPNSDQFLRNITTLVTEETISSKDLGLLAWAPKLVDQYKQQDQVREVSARFERKSDFLGRLKEKIVVNFTLIESRYVPVMNCQAVYGYSDCGNLVFYWANKPERVVTQGLIEGRVKEHKQDSHHNNARITVLNYVKVL